MIEELTVTLKTSEDSTHPPPPKISKLKEKSQFSGISETKSALDKGYLWPGCDTF